MKWYLRKSDEVLAQSRLLVEEAKGSDEGRRVLASRLEVPPDKALVWDQAREAFQEKPKHGPPADDRAWSIAEMSPRRDDPRCDSALLPSNSTSIGLALSGGGIRSAAFSLGALESLAKSTLYERITTISAVSGGGFAAATEVVLRKELAQRQNAHVDLRCDAIDAVRQRSAYLAPGPTLSAEGPFSLVTNYLYGLLFGVGEITSIIGLITALLLLVLALGSYEPTVGGLPSQRHVLAFWLAVSAAYSYALIAAQSSSSEWYRRRRGSFSVAYAMCLVCFASSAGGTGWLPKALVATLITLVLCAFGDVRVDRPRVVVQASALSQVAFLVDDVIRPPNDYKSLLEIASNHLLATGLLSTCIYLFAEARSRGRAVLGGTAALIILLMLLAYSLPGTSLFLTEHSFASQRTPVYGVLLAFVGVLVAGWLESQAGNSRHATRRRDSVRKRVLHSAMGATLALLLGLAGRLNTDSVQLVSMRIAETFVGLEVLVVAVLCLGVAASVVSSSVRLHLAAPLLTALIVLTLTWLHLEGMAILLNLEPWVYWRLPTLRDASPLALYALLSVASYVVLFLMRELLGRGIWSLHYFYRDRLFRAFVQAPRACVRAKYTLSAGDAEEDPRLSDMGESLEVVFGAVANVTQHQQDVSDRRRAVPFELGSKWCGSSLTGWMRSHAYDAGSVTLSKAMAVSGAAVAPRMGFYSNRWLWFLLSFFNLRLGARLPNPAAGVLASSALPLVPEFVDDIEGEQLYVTDGGHYDNSGILALVARKTRFIVAIDAEQDNERSFKGLADAVRMARTDFNVSIEIDTRDLQPQGGPRRTRDVCAGACGLRNFRRLDSVRQADHHGR